MKRFYKNRKIFYGISIALILIGVIFIFINGVSLDIQFSGGSKITYDYKGEIPLQEAEALVEETLGRTATAQQTVGISDETYSLVLSLGGKESITTEDQDKLTTAFAEKYPDSEISLASIRSVEPYIGRQFLIRGILAIVLAMVLIVIYVTIRFKLISGLSAALTALLALLHDLVLVFMTFVVFKIPINDGFVAVVLTILGYSVNATIVIYDRIRANKRLYGSKLTIEEIADKSISQTLARTINTSLMTVIAIMLVFIFAMANGLTSVANFALPLMVGTISGCYSSITLPGTLWVSWQKHKLNKKEA